jgi:hypothetical protein
MNDKPPDRIEEDEVQSDVYDKFIGAEVTVDFGMEGRKRAIVRGRVKDFEGNFVGKSHSNPLLDTMAIANTLLESGIHSNINWLEHACVACRDEIDVATQIVELTNSEFKCTEK